MVQHINTIVSQDSMSRSLWVQKKTTTAAVWHTFSLMSSITRILLYVWPDMNKFEFWNNITVMDIIPNFINVSNLFQTFENSVQHELSGVPNVYIQQLFLSTIEVRNTVNHSKVPGRERLTGSVTTSLTMCSELTFSWLHSCVAHNLHQSQTHLKQKGACSKILLLL